MMTRNHMPSRKGCIYSDTAEKSLQQSSHYP
jgi:hypothetical protein